MASSATIDIESLLVPISESAPAGVNLRADVSPTSIYYRLKDARSGARAAERRLDGEGAAAGALLPEWQSILTLAPKALAENSKDLEVCAWLIEGMVRAHGFAGLRDGMLVARGLIERYWDSFFSLEDEEGMVTRLAPLSGLNGMGNEGTLIQPLRKIFITDVRNDEAFAIYHYEQARSLAKLDKAQAAKRETRGDVNMERFTAAVKASGGMYYVTLLDDLDGCLVELKALSTGLSERAGRDAPSTSDIAAVVTMIRDTVAGFSEDLVKQARAQIAAEAAAAEAAAAAALRQATTASEEEKMTPEDSVKIGGTLRGREEALRNLQQIADYFRTHEPHSPISNCIDEIVRRAKMPFAQLLAELLPDANAWRSVLVSAGIKPPAA